ncbi:MAG: ATP-binding protein [Gemmatimonadetes bacterium]|nr:ATP-binding protein [Gemmatimonadota bacterium]
MYRQRLLTQRLRELAAAFPVVVLSGARQVGKSTLLQHLYGDKADIVVFDPVVDVGNARQDAELFLANNRPPLILDEVQYAPELIASLKREIDKDRSPGQYILSGSQQWSVLTSVSESLAGRAAFLDLEGFSLAEAAGSGGSWLASWIADPARFLASPPSRLQDTRTFYESLWRGGLPDATLIAAAVVPDFHAAYQRTYIERDVRLLADVADWQLFGRFIRLCAALSAQEVNRRQLGRELGVTPQTADRWLGLLKATYQWFEVPAYSGNAVKRVSGKPKGYLADTGMACHAQLLSSPESLGGHPMLGALFETAVVAEIRKQAGAMSTPPQMYHWRTNGGAEVDLLLERDGRFYPIKIKLAGVPSRRDTTGISAFRKTYPGLRIEPGLVIAPIREVLQVSEQDWAIPWDLDGR